MDMEELRIQARKKALHVAKAFGWPIPGREYQEEFESVLERLIKEKIQEEKEKEGV